MIGLSVVDENTPDNKKMVCHKCNGKGEVPHVYGSRSVTYTTCWMCHGKGELLSIGICGVCRKSIEHGCDCTPVFTP